MARSAVPRRDAHQRCGPTSGTRARGRRGRRGLRRRPAARASGQCGAARVLRAARCPDSSRSCGEPKTPADTMTSRLRRCAQSRPDPRHRCPSARAPIERDGASHGGRSAPSSSAARARGSGTQRRRCSGVRGAASPGRGLRRPVSAPLKSRFRRKAGARLPTRRRRGTQRPGSRGPRRKARRRRRARRSAPRCWSSERLKDRQHRHRRTSPRYRARPSRRSRIDGRACRSSR